MIDINRYVMHSKQCVEAFERMFWACFWVLDFRFMIEFKGLWINLLPDLMGWFMVATALDDILGLSSVVTKLHRYVWVLMGLSLFDIVGWRRGGLWWGIPEYLWILIPGILIMTLIWGICGLIMAMAEAEGDRSLRSTANLCRGLYVGTYFLVAVVPLTQIIPPSFFAATWMVWAALSLFKWLLLMKVLLNTANLCMGLR